MNPDWLLPRWPVPAHVKAVFTTRSGGTSEAPYDTLNLGDHVGDMPGAVAKNRTLFAQSINAQPVFLSQVHGTATIRLSDKTAHGTQADACLTEQPGVACTIMVADCLSVLLTNAQGSRVAAAHAGWRGLAGEGGQGVLESVVRHFKVSNPVDTLQTPEDIVAWLGPCIGLRAFEVGADVRDTFVSQDPATQAMFTPVVKGKWLANLQGLARMRLLALGITQIYGNDGDPAWCTVSQPSRFYSHRRDRVSGRMAACVWLG